MNLRTLGKVVLCYICMALIFLAGRMTAQTPPTANFTYTCSGMTCTFNGSTSVWPNGRAPFPPGDPRFWTAGDGTPERQGGTTFTYTYATDGFYNVRFRIVDPLGLQDDTVQVVRVGNPNLPPVARFISSCDGLLCSFNALSSSDDRGIASYEWVWGDTTTTVGTGFAPGHTYPGARTWTVMLTVRDSTGLTSTRTDSVRTTQLNLVQSQGRTIVEYRGALGLTQAVLAQRVGIPATRLSRIERGLEVAPDSLLTSIARVLLAKADTVFSPQLETKLWSILRAARR